MIKVAIVEDHHVLVDSLRLLFRNEKNLSLIGSADTIAGGKLLLEREKPDVLLLDVGLPDGDGLELIPVVKQVSPGTNIVLLTSLSDEYTLLRAVDSGISGYVSKSSSLIELMETIHKAAAGEIVIPPSLLIGLLKRMPRGRAVVDDGEQMREQLTTREREVLYHLAHGKTGDTISKELNISPLTVRTHIRNMMSKLGVHSRLEAVAYGMRHGLIDSQS